MTRQIRSILYFFAVISEDDETQRHGMIYIFTARADNIGISVEDFRLPETRSAYEKLSLCMPVRTSALHVCLEEQEGSPLAVENALYRTLRAFVILMLRNNTRVRTRVHQGELALRLSWRSCRMFILERHKLCTPSHCPCLLSILNPLTPFCSLCCSWLRCVGGCASPNLTLPRFPTSGLNMETKYNLMSFGIKVNEIPMTSSGTIKTKNHQQWIRTRKAIDERRRVLEIRQCRQEEQSHTSSGALPNSARAAAAPTSANHRDGPGSIIVHPGIHDVLIAKGGKCNHWGNIDFQCLMGIHQNEYKDLPKRSPRRGEIRDELILAVHERGGRFLELDSEIVSNGSHNKSPKKRTDSGDWWREITDRSDLDDRIKTAMYDYIRRLEAKRNIQRNKSGTVKFSGLDGTTMNNKRRRLLLVNGEPALGDGGRGGTEGDVGSDTGDFPCGGGCI
jgi:hypothetical protein